MSRIKWLLGLLVGCAIAGMCSTKTGCQFVFSADHSQLPTTTEYGEEAMAGMATDANGPKDQKREENVISIAFGNLANAANDEKSEQYRFGSREFALHEAIAGLRVDVFAASELRICMDKEKKFQLQPAQIAARLAQGTGLVLADCRPQNLDVMTFWRATFFKSPKLEMVVSGSEWAIPPVFGSSKVEERGVMLLFTQFRYGSNTFWVINSHMPLATTEKLKTIDWLNANAEKVCNERWNDKNPVIIYGGDQNTFFDRDGDEMLKRFAAGGWVHVSSSITETFRSFPHDAYQGVSLLDHVFVNEAARNKIKIKSVEACDTKASDHYFLKLSFSF